MLLYNILERIYKMLEKEKYKEPELEIVTLSDADIICTSRPGEDDRSNDGEWM